MNDEVERDAGWYYDDAMPHVQKFWDGEKWTGQVAPRGNAPTVTPTIEGMDGVWKIALGVGMALVVVIFCVWAINGMVTGNDDLECTVENAERAMDGLPSREC